MHNIKMKKILFYIALAIGTIACDTQADSVLPGPEKAPKLNIVTTEKDHVIETEGGSTTVKFLSTNDWTARIVLDNGKDKEDWCVLKTASGIGDEINLIELKVVANANPTYENRSATVTITSGNYNKSTKITQKQLDALTILNPQYNITAKGEVVNVEIKSNVASEVKIDSNIDWVKRVDNVASETRAYAPMLYRFEVAPNTTGAERQTDIHFVYKNIDEKVTFIQAAEADEE